MWFAASTLKVVKLQQGSQSTFPVFETVFLVEADNFEEAEQSALQMARAVVEAGNDLTYCDQPARFELLGIRKLKLIWSADLKSDPGEKAPAHGTEVTESFYEVEGEENLAALSAGKRTTVSLVDDDD